MFSLTSSFGTAFSCIRRRCNTWCEKSLSHCFLKNMYFFLSMPLKVTSALSTPFVLFTLSNWKRVRGQARWNSYSSTMAGMRDSSSSICLISCILLCSKGACLYTVLSSAPWQGSPCCWAMDSHCESFQAQESAPGLLCSASCFWKWVCREEESPSSDAIHACQRSSTKIFWNLVQLQKGWNSHLHTIF